MHNGEWEKFEREIEGEVVARVRLTWGMGYEVSLATWVGNKLALGNKGFEVDTSIDESPASLGTVILEEGEEGAVYRVKCRISMKAEQMEEVEAWQ
jgi:hypothetical protein